MRDLPTGIASLDPLVVAGAVLAAAVLALLALRAGARLALAAGRGVAVGWHRAVLALAPRAARRCVAALVGLLAPVLGGSASVASAMPAPVAAPATDPLPAHDTPVARAPRPAAGPPAVRVVRRGESLWSIARDHLGPAATDAQVARAWPRWWAANRRVIGPDPSLIVPGQHLRVPGRRSAGTPTQQHAAPAPTTGTPVPSALSLDPDRR